MTTASVLVNDTDDDGDAMSVIAVDVSATQGLVADNGDGTFNYDPNGAFDELAEGESATDMFAYTISDGKGGESTATVTITINGVDEPVDDVEPPTISAMLADDTGEAEDDSLTSNPEISGSVSDNIGVTALFARAIGSDAGAFVDTSSALQLDGSFTLDEALLTQLNGGALADGFQGVVLFARDAAGNDSAQETVSFTLDRTAPGIEAAPTGVLAVAPGALQVSFDEAVAAATFDRDNFTLTDSDGVSIAITSIDQISSNTIQLNVGSALGNGEFTLAVSPSIADLAGNSLAGETSFDFSVDAATQIVSISPTDGTRLSNVDREIVIEFDRAIDPATITSDAIKIIANGEELAGRFAVSNNERIVTFFPDETLPASTRIRIEVDGDEIIGRDGRAVDADGDAAAGGLLQAEFSTVSLSRIPDTNLEGFIYDSNNKGPNGEDIPLEGVVVSVVGLPGVTAVTDENGRFFLEDLPIPDVYLHFDASPVTAETGFEYGTIVKPGHTVAGQTVQMAKPNGMPFNIYFAAIPETDAMALTPGEDTEVGLGDFGMQNLIENFPDVDPAEWEKLKVTIPADSLTDENGDPVEEVTIMAFEPDRIPAPLPDGVDANFVFTVAAGDATNVNGKAQVELPNLDGLAPGEKRPIYSFDHDAGKWIITGTAIVSEDGSKLVSEGDSGVNTLGWKFLGLEDIVKAIADFFGIGGDDNEDPNPSGLSDDFEEDVFRAIVAENTEFYRGIADVSVSLATKGVPGGDIAPKLFLDRLKSDIEKIRTGGISDDGSEIDRLAEALREGRSFIPKPGDILFEEALADGGSYLPTPRGILMEFAERKIAREQFIEDLANGRAEEIAEEKLRDFVRKSLAEGTPQEEIDRRLQEASRDFATQRENFRAFSEESDDIEFFINGVENSVSKLEDLIEELRNNSSNSNLESDFLQTSDSDAQLADEILMLLDDLLVTLNDTLEITASFEFVDSDGNFASYLSVLFSSFQQSEAEFQDLFEVSFSAVGGVFFRVGNADGEVSRGFVSDLSNLSVIVPRGEVFRLEYFNPSTGETGVGELRSDGVTPVLGVISRDDELDDDEDDLSNSAERVLGTSPDNPDTDGDGILDGAEVEQGLDPLDGRAFPTGIISALDVPGSAEDVAVEGALDNAGVLTAYIATGQHGLVLVDVSDFKNPILLGRIDLEGDNRSVAVDMGRALTYVAGGEAGLHVIDVSDPLMPALVSTTEIEGGATAVYNLGGAVLVAGAALTVHSTAGGPPIQIVDIGAPVIDIALDGGTVYALTERTLTALSFNGTELEVISTFDLPFPDPSDRRLDSGASLDDPQIFINNGVAYIANGFESPTIFVSSPEDRGGYVTVDVSDPSDMMLISDIDTPEVQNGNAETVVNGSGLALVAGGARGLQIHNASDPTVTYDLITEIATPGSARAVDIASGIAFVADGEGGLITINYLSFDAQGIAPTLDVDISIADADPDTPGIQVIEGSFAPVGVFVTDDVQVRNVELLVDGAVVQNDVSAPFNLSLIAPNLDEGADTIIVQVRVTDTGGNATLSDEYVFNIVEDFIAPTITGVNIDNGDVVFSGQRTVSIAFSEAIDFETLSLDDVSFVTESGDRLTPDNLALIGEDRIAQFTFSDLPADNYILEINLAEAADRAGNVVGGDVLERQLFVVDQPTVTVSGSSIPEGTSATSGDQLLAFTIEITPASDEAVRVYYRTLPGVGSASETDDYDSLNSFVDFAAGETSQTVSVRTNGFDDADEADESVVLELYDVTGGAAFAGGAPSLRATGFILDDDGTGNDRALVASSPVLVEGDDGTVHAVFELRLSEASSEEIVVSYATADGSALAGEDYGARSGTVTFLAGQTVASVIVPVTGDGSVEGTETFSLILGASPSVAQTTSGIATILDDDAGTETLSFVEVEPQPDMVMSDGNEFLMQSDTSSAASVWLYENSGLFMVASRRESPEGIEAIYSSDSIQRQNSPIDQMQEMVFAAEWSSASDFLF